MKLKLFISDLDGTIVETEDYHRKAYNHLFKELGIDKTWSKQDYIKRLQTMGGNKFREVFGWLNIADQEYAKVKTELYQRKTELYVELISKDLRDGSLELRPGIKRFLNEIMTAGIPIAIATACVGWAAEKVLAAALGEPFLESLACLCGGESTQRHKPAPDVYIMAANKSGVSPEFCAVLEDTSHGMIAAKEAGMICVATPSEFAREHDFSRADLVLQDLETPNPFRLEDLMTYFLRT